MIVTKCGIVRHLANSPVREATVRVMLAILTVAAVQSVTAAGWAAERPRTAVPVDSIVGEPEQWMEVSTNAPYPVPFEIRKSHRTGDLYCRDTEGDARGVIVPPAPRQFLFAFARQQSPGIALYEWHVCFVIAGTTYRAWHGFDPGPGAAIHAHCFIDAEQISAKDLTKNTCPTADVTANPANYREFSVNAPTGWTAEPCIDVQTFDGSGPRGEECLRGHGASDGSGPVAFAELRQRNPRAPHLNVSTNSPYPLSVAYRLSRTPNDYDCKLAQGTHWTISSQFTVAAGKLAGINIGTIGFNVQFLPATAVYEWHICFVIDNTLYRAWRGYDPGPRGALTLDCFLDAGVLRTKDTTRYLCSTTEAALNPANYNEFGIYCEPGNPNACQRFATKDEFDSWRAVLNPLSTEEQDQIAEAVVKYAYTHTTYLSANANFPPYLSIRGRDPSPEFLQRVSEAAGITLMPGSKMPMQRVGTVIQTGGNMLVSVGAFTVTEPNIARGGISGFCGVLCAGGSAVTVQKHDDAWEVQSVTLTSVQ